ENICTQVTDYTSGKKGGPRGNKWAGVRNVPACFGPSLSLPGRCSHFQSVP
uniref:Uncharacterized protein n=1 Tax=Salmo trutta TaxID=8032 RepID=A0A674ED80_SALTR